MKYRKNIFLIVLFNCIVSLIFALQQEEYSYAAGVNNEIEINWRFNSEGNDFLGCNLFRYDSLNTVYTQVNDTIITSSDNSFSFIDTQNINDTINYKYEIEYVWIDTSYTQMCPIFALKRIDFEVQSDEELNVILEFRKNIGYVADFYVSGDNIGWEPIGQTFINQTDTLSINPYQFWGNYFLIEFQDWSLENPFIGYLKLSMNYLIEIIEGTSIEENIAYPNIKEITCWNYPNPFNPATTFYFSIPEETNVDLSIYNIKGQRVKVLVNEFKPAGEHSVIWDGRDSNGNRVSSGIYFYKLTINNEIEHVMKCLLLK